MMEATLALIKRAQFMTARCSRWRGRPGVGRNQTHTRLLHGPPENPDAQGWRS